MDLTQLANLGEFIGGIAVLVTLVYLAVQVRTGAAETRDNTTLQIVSLALESRRDIMSGPLAEVLVKVGTGEALTATERERYFAFFQHSMNLHELVYLRIRDGKLDPRLASGYKTRIGVTVTRPLFKEFWRRGPGDHSKLFGDFVDGLLQETGVARS